jgi:hypothetical protein
MNGALRIDRRRVGIVLSLRDAQLGSKDDPRAVGGGRTVSVHDLIEQRSGRSSRGAQQGDALRRGVKRIFILSSR